MARPVSAVALPLVAAGTLVGTLGTAGPASAAPRTLWADLTASIRANSLFTSNTITIDPIGAPGQVGAFGDAQAEGQPSDLPGASAAATDVVGIARTPSGNGYWVATASGGVFSYGDATFHGSLGNQALNQPIVGIAATPNGGGYWLVAADGGVFSFGNARFYGSMGGDTLKAPVVGIAATPSGRGYWVAAADGGVFSFGDASYHGGLAGTNLNQPVVGIAATGTGGGYWLAAEDGGVFTFGDATFHGSLPGMDLTQEIRDIAPSPSGDGYWLAASDGGVYAFGDALYRGRVVATSSQVAGFAASPDGQGYLEITGHEPPPPPPPPAPAPAAAADPAPASDPPPAPAPAPAPAVTTASTSGAPAGFRSLGTFEVTCYDLTGATATGVQAGPGIVAVDPRVISLGSTVWIQGVGTVSAQDTGGAILGSHIDLWLSPDACYQWGLQYRQIAVS